MALESLNLPKETIYKQFIPKQQFYTHANFKQSEVNMFVEGIERITLYAQLTRDNTNIDVYKDEDRKYDEVSVFFVGLRKIENIDKIVSIIMESIPYPIIFIGKYGKQYNFYGAHQRDNKQDEQKIILDKIYQTGFMKMDNSFINTINYRNLSKVNFYTLYNDFIQEIIQFNLASRNIKETENNEDLLSEIEKLEEEITLLKNKMQRENHFNKKMEFNMNIKRLEKQLKQMEE